MATKISALVTAASGAAGQRVVVVSGNTNKQLWLGNNGGGSGLFGGLLFATEATVAASATTNVVALTSADLTGFYVRAMPGSSGGAGGSIVQIGVATDQTRLGTVTTSGIGFYDLVFPNMSAAAMRNFTGTITAVAPSATAASVFMVGAYFLKR